MLAAVAMFLASSAALAHSYHVGDLEIVHPAVMVPSAKSDCSCAHVKIVNHGARTEYFLGAIISAASRTHLVKISTGGHGLTMPMRVEIPPGKTPDLSRHEWCLFISGITQTLEADMGVVPGQLLFENQGAVPIEFMIDEANH